MRSPGLLPRKLVVQWARGHWRELWSVKCSLRFREPCLRQFPLPLPEKLRPQVMVVGREAVEGGGGRSAASLVQEVGRKDELGAEDCEVHAWGFFGKSMENALSF